MPGADPAHLGELLNTLADAMIDEDRWWGPAHLVRVETDIEGEAFDVGFKDLEGHPLDDLLGFTAPDSWSAIGVACVGWGAKYEEDDAELVARGSGPRRPSQDPGRRRVRQVILVGREGQRAERMRMQGSAVTSTPSIGFVPDALHRCLGLSTDPPPAPVGEFVAGLWLDRVAALGRPAGMSLTWEEVEQLRPSLADLPLLHWDHLRLLIATGRVVIPEVAPQLAAWADAGLCSRLLLSRLSPSRRLQRDAEKCMSGATRRRLRAAIADLVESAPAA